MAWSVAEGTAGAKVGIEEVSPLVGLAGSGLVSVGDAGMVDADTARLGGCCSWARTRLCRVCVTSSRSISEENVVG